MTDSIYHALREKIDQYAIGFNETQSQVEIKLLKKLFTKTHAEMYMHLREALDSVDTIAERAKLDVESTGAILEEMTRGGLTFPRKHEGVQYYAAAPFVHGICENYAETHDPESAEFKEIAQLIHEYNTSGFFPKSFAMRTIPINDKIDDDQRGFVEPFENIIKIIESKDKIGVHTCACYLQSKALETKCDQEKEVCISFDFYAEYVIEGMGNGRWITKEEAIEILKQSEKEGLVHQISGDGSFVESICNCCPNCCGMLKLAKKFPIPGEVLCSNFFAQLNKEECINCGICIDRCPMGAFTPGEEYITLNKDRCIGCGLCTTACPAEALVLISKPQEKRTGVFPDGQYKFKRSSKKFDEDLKIKDHGGTQVN